MDFRFFLNTNSILLFGGNGKKHRFEVEVYRNSSVSSSKLLSCDFLVCLLESALHKNYKRRPWRDATYSVITNQFHLKV